MSDREYTPKQEAEYIDYLNSIRVKGYKGGNIPEDFPNKPSGFIEWLKDNPQHRLKLKRREVENIACWNCGKEYPEDYRKCPNPSCRAFNTKANKNR